MSFIRSLYAFEYGHWVEMNITTTALCDFAAEDREKALPSSAVSWKSGAEAPMAGAPATALQARTPRVARARMGRTRCMGIPPRAAERRTGESLFPVPTRVFRFPNPARRQT